VISEWARRWSQGIVLPLANLFHRAGISPNVLSILGLVVAFATMVVLALGHHWVGGVLIILAGGFDALDGTLARVSGRTSTFGAFLDSVLDRVAEAAIYGGLLYFYVRSEAWLEPLMIYITVVGSFLVSYARARAEGLGLECKEGLLTRFERLVILVVALIIGQVSIALVLLAVLTNVTALQRALRVWRAAQESPE
jgi:CDP-diacylglycerol--glycerol-3-phosphate 3-phosphatidyltransferase